ncbi:hypothetical protein CALVIDRAFT_596939 [Calocera viscosa TUFC12733]|uniref:Uncharacterized protein n=1 Tax=Calocera viscosa (strain TUFC12733) TaxID=1330018 RepID=A0A167P4X5_CALVF|nr:hypothetical protein CALVIDRAFT_596939 [Calocera viscosa TUFC12733]
MFPPIKLLKNGVKATAQAEPMLPAGPEVMPVTAQSLTSLCTSLPQSPTAKHPYGYEIISATCKYLLAKKARPEVGILNMAEPQTGEVDVKAEVASTGHPRKSAIQRTVSHKGAVQYLRRLSQEQEHREKLQALGSLAEGQAVDGAVVVDRRISRKAAIASLRQTAREQTEHAEVMDLFFLGYARPAEEITTDVKELSHANMCVLMQVLMEEKERIEAIEQIMKELEPICFEDVENMDIEDMDEEEVIVDLSKC